MDTSASSPCLRDARRAVDRLRASAERAAAASDEEAQRSGGDAGEAVYAADTARRAARAAQHAAAALEALPVDSDDDAAPLPRRAPLPVRRVHASKLSLSSFRREVEARGEPVVLEGLGAHLTEDGAAGAELGWLRRHAATKTVAVSRAHAHTRCELRAADYELCTVGELLDAVDAGEADGSYLYDCSMPLKLPSLLQAVRVPRFFAHDFLQRTMRLHAFSASWPSLFVAAPGTQSSLHVDQWQGHFWMAMVRGTKRWTLFAADDVHLLSPDWARNTLDPAMPPLDRLDAEPSEHPLACLARRWEVDLGPGEVLYVPGGCPHHVRNLDETVSFAGNYVDETNLERALEDMRLMGLKQGAQMMESYRAVDEVDFEAMGAFACDEAVEQQLPPEHLAVPCSAYRGGAAAQWGAKPPQDVLDELATLAAGCG